MSAPEARGDKSRILVVDDDETIRTLACCALDGDYSVDEAESGREGLDMFARIAPDLVLLDLVMPGVDGFAVCEEIRRQPTGRHVPIIIFSGLDDVDSLARAYEAGATDFITKPFNAVLLEQRVRYALRGSQHLQELWRNESLLSDAERIARLGSWELNLRTKAFLASHQFYEILGLSSEDEGTIELLLKVTHPEDETLLKNALDTAIQDESPFDIDHRIVRPDGEELVVHTQSKIVADDTTQAAILRGTIQDVSDAKRIQKKVHFLAYHDALTRLPNRSHFTDRLCDAIKLGRRHDLTLAVMFIDLDRFKRINDTLGHGVGDALLKQVADRLEKVVRKSDAIGMASVRSSPANVARIGGDEFTIALTDLQTVRNGALIAQRILDEAARPFKIGEREIYVTASIGIAVYPLDGADAGTLLKNADTALYHSKDRGGNTYSYYSPSMNEKALLEFTLESELHRAIRRDELYMCFQPKVSGEDGRIVGGEALIRWKHPEKGTIIPSDFLSVAEDAGILDAIDEWVLQEVCLQIREWECLRRPPCVPIAVNVSNSLFRRNDFVRVVKDALRSTSIDSRLLELELTESIVMKNPSLARARIEELRRLGVQFSIDDFGTGHSSLSTLKNFPVDRLKIDKAFVSDLATNTQDRAIMKAIIGLGHAMGLTVLAEGIDNPGQFKVLQECGCDEYQGFLFSRPVGLDEFLGLVSGPPMLEYALEEEKAYA